MFFLYKTTNEDHHLDVRKNGNNKIKIKWVFVWPWNERRSGIADNISVDIRCNKIRHYDPHIARNLWNTKFPQKWLSTEKTTLNLTKVSLQHEQDKNGHASLQNEWKVQICLINNCHVDHTSRGNLLLAQEICSRLKHSKGGQRKKTEKKLLKRKGFKLVQNLRCVSGVHYCKMAGEWKLTKRTGYYSNNTTRTPSDW